MNEEDSNRERKGMPVISDCICMLLRIELYVIRLRECDGYTCTSAFLAKEWMKIYKNCNILIDFLHLFLHLFKPTSW